MSTIWPMPSSFLSAMGIRINFAEHSSLRILYQSITIWFESPKTVAVVVMDIPTAQQHIVETMSPSSKLDFAKKLLTQRVFVFLHLAMEHFQCYPSWILLLFLSCITARHLLPVHLNVSFISPLACNHRMNAKLPWYII